MSRVEEIRCRGCGTWYDPNAEDTRKSALHDSGYASYPCPVCGRYNVAEIAVEISEGW